MRGRRGDKVTGRNDDKETGRLGDWGDEEKWRLGGNETGRQ